MLEAAIKLKHYKINRFIPKEQCQVNKIINKLVSERIKM